MAKTDESEPRRTRYERKKAATPRGRRPGFSIEAPPKKVELDEDYQIRVGLTKDGRFHEVDATEATQEGQWLTLVWRRKTFVKIQKVFLNPEDSYYKIVPVREEPSELPREITGRVTASRAVTAAPSGNYDPSQYREQAMQDMHEYAETATADFRPAKTPRVPVPENLIPAMPATKAMPDIEEINPGQ